jgi:hypothetical protein
MCARRTIPDSAGESQAVIVVLAEAAHPRPDDLPENLIAVSWRQAIAINN